MSLFILSKFYSVKKVNLIDEMFAQIPVFVSLCFCQTFILTRMLKTCHSFPVDNISKQKKIKKCETKNDDEEWEWCNWFLSINVICCDWCLFWISSQSSYFPSPECESSALYGFRHLKYGIVVCHFNAFCTALCAEDWQNLFIHSSKGRTTNFIIEASFFYSNSRDIEKTIWGIWMNKILFAFLLYI